MAEFEIIDEFTIEACVLKKDNALIFSDYLNSIGIQTRAKEKFSGNYGIFVRNEDDALRVKRELVKYYDSPYSKVFTKSSWERGKTFSDSKQIKDLWYLPFSFEITSITSVVEIICVFIYILSLFNEEWCIEYLALSRDEQFFNILNYYKLLTPIFVHFGFMHIAFNLVMFEAMARPIERFFGKSKLFSLVVSIGLLSNVLQYCFIDGNTVFGGLSGVVYGVIAYCALVSKSENVPDGFFIPKGLLAVSIIFIGLGFIFSGIANLCHLGGLVVGLVWGLVDLKKLNNKI
jgi:GlpG protein